jgi:hypothetical protein
MANLQSLLEDREGNEDVVILTRSSDQQSELGIWFSQAMSSRSVTKSTRPE